MESEAAMEGNKPVESTLRCAESLRELLIDLQADKQIEDGLRSAEKKIEERLKNGYSRCRDQNWYSHIW